MERGRRKKMKLKKALHGQDIYYGGDPVEIEKSLEYLLSKLAQQSPYHYFVKKQIMDIRENFDNSELVKFKSSAYGEILLLSKPLIAELNKIWRQYK